MTQRTTKRLTHTGERNDRGRTERLTQCGERDETEQEADMAAERLQQPLQQGLGPVVRRWLPGGGEAENVGHFQQ